jgi:hypothetical protein
MRITAGAGTRKMQCLYWPIKGNNRQHVLEKVCAFDTDEKWVEIFITQPISKGNARIMTADGQLIRARLFINFDIVDKTTGDILYSVRQ